MIFRIVILILPELEPDASTSPLLATMVVARLGMITYRSNAPTHKAATFHSFGFARLSFTFASLFLLAALGCGGGEVPKGTRVGPNETEKQATQNMLDFMKSPAKGPGVAKK